MVAKTTKAPKVEKTEKKEKRQKKEKEPEAEVKAEKTPKAKKASKKSNIPVITRPRGLTHENFEKYMASISANLDYRLNELETLHSDGKCPHKAVQHLRSVQREYQYIAKRFAPLTKRRRKQVDKTNNILMKKVNVSPKLAAFLKLKKGETVSRSECNTAITMYINIKDLKVVEPEKKKWVQRMNPGGKRNLQDPENGSVIHPDKALADLLDYGTYQKLVKAGKKVWKRKDKETKEVHEVVEENDQLTYAVVQHLLAPHFLKGDVPATKVKAEVVSEDDEVVASDDDDEVDSDE